jgi:hypothetical protein
VTVDAHGAAALLVAPWGTLLSLGPDAQGLQECERDGEDQGFVLVVDRHFGAGQAREYLDDAALGSSR